MRRELTERLAFRTFGEEPGGAWGEGLEGPKAKRSRRPQEGKPRPFGQNRTVHSVSCNYRVEHNMTKVDMAKVGRVTLAVRAGETKHSLKKQAKLFHNHLQGHIP